MGRPRKFIERKLVSDFLTQYDLDYLFIGMVWLPPAPKGYKNKMAQAWEKYQDDIMRWWHSDQSLKDLFPGVRVDLPVSDRRGFRPRFWWFDEGCVRLKISGDADGYDGNLYGIPGGYTHLHTEHLYESQFAYLKRTNQLTQAEKRLKLPLIQKVG